jgi:DNA-binding HxlR family transcriptional regulator
VVEVLANKWVLYVLGLLQHHGRPLRFGELRREIEGVTQKSLTQTLRALERDGLVERKAYPVIPPRVEYRLTELGLEVGQLTTAISGWALKNAPQVAAARMSFDARPDQDDAEAGAAWT